MPELDGVRGIAVLLVLICHSNVIQEMPSGGPANLRLGDLLFLGWSGVDLFFVLSGFLITGILLDSRTAKNYFSSFYVRRILRIVPLYVVAVFAYFHLLLPVVHRFGYCQNLNGATEKWFWFHLSNWASAFGGNSGWLQHFWSLAIEEQFYLFWPLVVFLAGRRLSSVCVILIAASLGLRCLYVQHAYGALFLYELTPFRIEPLAYGSLAAAAVRNTTLLPVLASRRFLYGVAACGAFLLDLALSMARSTSFARPPMATFGFSSFAILYACLVLYAYTYSGSSARLARFLGLPWLTAFGKYSYAIYVFHFPIFAIYGRLVQRASALLPEASRLAFWTFALITGIGLSYVAAFASWNLLEKYCMELKGRFAVRY